MNKLSAEDAQQAIVWEAEQHVPYDINDVSLDFEILGDAPQDDKQMQVLLVAAKKDMVLTFADLIREAGLSPVVIDVDSFAIQNALSANYDFAPDEVIAILNVGAEITNINIVQNGVPYFTKDLQLGGHTFVDAVQRRYNVSQDQAIQAVRGEVPRDRRGSGRGAGLRGPGHRARARAGLPAHDRRGRPHLAPHAVRRLGADARAGALPVESLRGSDRGGEPAQPHPVRQHPLRRPGPGDGGAVPDGGHRPGPQKGGRQVIRINLMPLEERGQKARKVKKHKAGGAKSSPAGLLLPLAIVAGVLVAIVGTVVHQQAQIHMLAGEVARVEEESRALAPQIAMVERLSRERSDLDMRLSLIDQLSRGRFDAVRLVDELDRSIPDHMWLSSALGDGSTITIEGTTFSNLIIADLMIRLDRSPLFSNVALGQATRGIIDEVDVVQFKLTMNLTPAESAPGDR